MAARDVRYDLGIIGGGIIGTAAAAYAAEAGLRVVLFERAEIAAAASGFPGAAAYTDRARILRITNAG